MRTTLTVTLLVALAAPASAQKADALLAAAVGGLTTTVAQSERESEQARLERERALERAERERERALEEASRARERTEEQSQAERERALEQAEREREQAQKERQRALEQAQRDRERAQEQAQRDRERAQEQAQRERERAAEQRQRDLERAAQDRERAAEERARARERAAEQRNGAFLQTERISRTVRIGANGELDVANVAGDIVITRGSGNDAVIEIVKTGRGRSDADAKEVLQLVHVDVVERGPRIEVRARYPEGDELRRNNRRNVSVSVAINITAPAGTRVRATSISGSLTARDIKGDISLESVSGMVRVANGGRVSVAKSLSGDVEVSETDMDGGLEASTASGSIVLRRVKARSLDVGSISGNVVLDDVQCPRVEAQTVSGDVRFGGVVTKNSRYDLKSHSGNLQVWIAGGSGFELDATSFSGSVRSEFPMNGDAGNPRRSNSLRGVYGDGSAVLDLTTFSGSIIVSKR
jgi:DUF4097 and DUF4098 domain-containing protein YvlB